MHTICPDCGLVFAGPGSCTSCGATLGPVDDPLLGHTIGTYRVTRLLGAGAMGRVYRAVQPHIGARVAVKVLSVEGAAKREAVERFFAEARAVNVIRHDGIVNIIDLAVLPDGRPYIVMEFLDGAPLSLALARRGALPLGTLAQLMAEVLDALAAAHARGIVHRDLKPDNVWITNTGRAKVLDFGIAKLDPSLSGATRPTRIGAVLGTPSYMSPEQGMAKRVDARTDLYAVGVILYEGVAGAPPFTASSPYEMLRMHFEDPPPRLVRPGLPPAYEEVIRKALEKDPAQRFAGAGEMSAALMEAARGLPPEEWSPVRVTETNLAAAPQPAAPVPRLAPRRTGLWLGLGVAIAGVGAAAIAVVATREPEAAAPAAAPASAGQPARASPVIDAHAWLSYATRVARERLADDAELTMMSLPNVRPDGLSDFAASTVAQYHFRSPHKSEPGAPCLVDVVYSTGAGVQAAPRNDPRCDAPVVGPPRCNPKQVWDRALAAGAPGGAVATLVWGGDGKKWTLTVDGSTPKQFEDDCP